ncbi:CCR9 protein, partial [Brachypteracias leptosomus]|nr:CCR9 protein [Brachypteracias leptosomus]
TLLGCCRNSTADGDLLNATDLPCDRSRVRHFARTVLPAFFWLIFCLGTLGNTLVVLVCCRYHLRRRRMDQYLLHLAVADLLLLLTLPFWARAASDGWIFKSFMCKVVNSLYKINFYGCSLFLTCISFHRYVTIVRGATVPASRRRRLLRSKLLCWAVWATSVGLCVPDIIYSQSLRVGDVVVCQVLYPPEVSTASRVTLLALKVTVGFFLALLVMAVCYALIIKTLLRAQRCQKQKSLKIIAALLTAFLLSQLPYNVLLLVRAIHTYPVVGSSCRATDRLDVGLQVTQGLAFLHPCLNPFLYVFAGERFRRVLGRVGWGGGGGQEVFSSSREHGSSWAFTMLGRRRVRSSLTLSTHLASSIAPPPGQGLQ